MLHMRRCSWFAVACSAIAVLIGCGAAQEPEPVEAPRTTGFEAPPSGSQMEVAGLYGTIPERKIEQTLEPKLPRFQRCFADATPRVEFIAGRAEFYFRVALDGHVESVFLRGSTVGDRPTEQCLLEVARATRFPKPQGGGPAELAWDFEVGQNEDVRPPIALSDEQLVQVVEANRDALAGCGQGPFSVTAYVAPGGQVSAAGAAVDSIAAAADVDCVVDAVKTWAMPDPGSYPAKVSFRVGGER
jgi:hypothetical protein